MSNLLRFIFLLLSCVLIDACQPTTDTIRPQRGSITESVYTSATVQPEGLYRAYAAAAGILDTLLVEAGDTVRYGQIIARVVSDNPTLSRESARLNVALAEDQYRGQASQLRPLAEEIETAARQLRLDSLNYARQRKLWAQGVGTRTDLEGRELRYQQARSTLQTLRQRYAQTQAELRNAYERSRNALSQAETTLADYAVRARTDGRVYQLLKEAGELIGPQEPLALLGRADAFVVELAVDEADVARVRPGQSVAITLDAYPDQSFAGRVTRVFPQKDARTQTFKAEAVFSEPPATLYAGLAGEANVVVQSRPDVLTIPVEYLGDSNRVMTDDGAVTVQTGLRSLDRVEITAGLDTNSVILKP